MKHTDRQACKKIVNRKIDKADKADRQKDIYTYRKLDRQTTRQTGIQKARQTFRQ